MYQSERVELYRQGISPNLDTLTLALDSGNYPRLNHYLRQTYSGAAFKRLCNFHDYFLKGGIDKFSYEEHRGIEVLASMATLANAYGGSVWTWYRRLLEFQILGLVILKRPKKDDIYNSNRQNASVQRAEEASAKSGRRYNPCNWYRIPVYDDALFVKAESRVDDLKRIKGKASLVDLYGTREASRILDNHTGITEGMKAKREALLKALEIELSNNGYAYPNSVIERAATLLKADIRSVENAWKQYLPTLLEENNLRKGKPTKQQREMFNLASMKHIITRL